MADDFGLEIYGSPRPGETSEQNIFYTTKGGNKGKPIVIDSLEVLTRTSFTKTYNLSDLGLQNEDIPRFSAMVFSMPSENASDPRTPAGKVTFNGLTMHFVAIPQAPTTAKTIIIVYLK